MLLTVFVYINSHHHGSKVTPFSLLQLVPNKSKSFFKEEITAVVQLYSLAHNLLSVKKALTFLFVHLGVEPPIKMNLVNRATNST
jgi:hypothetical protein